MAPDLAISPVLLTSTDGPDLLPVIRHVSSIQRVYLVLLIAYASSIWNSIANGYYSSSLSMDDSDGSDGLGGKLEGCTRMRPEVAPARPWARFPSH